MDGHWSLIWLLVWQLAGYSGILLMARMMKTFLITLSLVVLSWTALGTTVNTPAAVVTMGLRMVITRYLANGGDIDALSMDTIIPMVDLEAANSSAQGKFEDRFVILGGNGPVDPVTKAKMIVYTANRIGEDRRDTPGRYVIWLAGGEVNSNWESEEKVAALLGNAGMKLVDRGPWTQPDTRAQSMFHVGVGTKPPPDDHRVQEDQAGRRLPIPNAKTQKDPQQNGTGQPGTPLQQGTAPGVMPPPTVKEPEPQSAEPKKEPASSEPGRLTSTELEALKVIEDGLRSLESEEGGARAKRARLGHEAMESFLKSWNPIGRKPQDLKALFGKPKEESDDFLLYAFDNGSYAWLYRFMIRDGTVGEITRPLSE